MSFTVVTCNHCPAQIIWANTGSAMTPVNAVPVATGTVVLVPRAVGSPKAIVTTDASVYPDLPRYVSHFDSCPAASDLRRPRARKAVVVPQSDALF